MSVLGDSNANAQRICFSCLTGRWNKDRLDSTAKNPKTGNYEYCHRTCRSKLNKALSQHTGVVDGGQQQQAHSEPATARRQTGSASSSDTPVPYGCNGSPLPKRPRWMVPALSKCQESSDQVGIGKKIRTRIDKLTKEELIERCRELTSCNRNLNKRIARMKEREKQRQQQEDEEEEEEEEEQEEEELDAFLAKHVDELNKGQRALSEAGFPELLLNIAAAGFRGGIKPGRTTDVMWHFVNDMARNVLVPHANCRRYSPEVKKFLGLIALKSEPAYEEMRGPGGGGFGTAAKSDESFMYLNLPIPRYCVAREFALSLNGGDPKWTGGTSIPKVMHFLKTVSTTKMGKALLKAGRPLLATHLTDGTDLQVSKIHPSMSSSLDVPLTSRWVIRVCPPPPPPPPF